MNDPGRRRPALVADRVGALLRGNLKLGDTRHELRCNRIPTVGGVDQSGDILGNGDSKMARHPSDFLEAFRLDQARANKIVRANFGSPCAAGHSVALPALPSPVSDRAPLLRYED